MTDSHNRHRFLPYVICVAVTWFLSCCTFATGVADDQHVSQDSKSNPGEVAEAESPEELAARIRRSIVVVRATGRDGREYGHGTGFMISSDGLIATARHVIGDGREIRIELPDGTRKPVTHVHAVTEAVDLAIVQIDASDLPALSLAEGEIAIGQTVSAVGFPGSTQDSFFRGLVSGRQQIDNVSMLKLAMTVEPGSSGEPVVDDDGRVVGVVTLKSRDVSGVGYALPVRHLTELLDDPVRMPIERWKTIGALDAKRWQVLWDANWRQRASRILVDGYGSAFGGRSLCLSEVEPPGETFEIQVDVRLEDENGAAGLAFHADGDDRHYGFYPSAGNIRLTRFNGPDLNSWTILFNDPVTAYRPGEWNSLKVRISPETFQCFVNGQRVLESTDKVLPPGRTGLAVFRGTSAQFRRFRIAESIPSSFANAEQSREIRAILDRVTAARPADADTISQLKPFRNLAAETLEQEARRLEQRAKHVRQLATDLHVRHTIDELLQSLQANDDQSPDLLKAALLVAVLDNSEVDHDSYVERVDQLAAEIKGSIPDDASESDRIAALDKTLFREYGFRGSRFEYYTSSNSYLNEVIDDREGLPISLSVLYIELARRLQLDVKGLGLPGHFVVQWQPADPESEAQIIDVFERGKRLSRMEAEEVVRAAFRNRVRVTERVIEEFFVPQTAKQIIERMLRNLLSLAERDRNDEQVLRYLEALVALNAQEPDFRARRLEIRARTGRLAEAIEDADWFIRELPEGTNSDRLYELRAQLQRQHDEQQKAAVEQQ